MFSSSTPLTKTSGIIVKEKVCKIPYGTFVYTLTSGWNKNQYLLNMSWNRTSGVMVSVLASRAVDRGFEPGPIKPNTIKLVFVASPLSTQH